MSFKTGLACTMAMLLAACGTFHPKTDQEIVAERSQQRMDALKKGDTEAAYAFMSPAYRESTDLAHFQVSVGAGGRWLVESQVKNAECDEDTCTVLVDAKYRFQDKGAGPASKPMIVPRENEERWIKVDGNWWFIKLD